MRAGTAGTRSARGSGPRVAGADVSETDGVALQSQGTHPGADGAEVSAQASRTLGEDRGQRESRGARAWREEADFQQQMPPPLSASSPRPLPLCPGFSPWKPSNAPRLPVNCLCPHPPGDASGRLGRRENLFPDPIQRRGLPVRDLPGHRRHRLQGEVAAGSASRREPGCGSGPGTALSRLSRRCRTVARGPEGTRAAPGKVPLRGPVCGGRAWLLARCRL